MMKINNLCRLIKMGCVVFVEIKKMGLEYG